METSQRLALPADLPAIATLMDRAIGELQRAFLSPEQVAASRASMGLDRRLIADGTYWLVFADGRLAGCGGWSFRATLYGGDGAAELRDPALLDPRRDAARIRAMYTDPAFARRGIGRLVLALCEDSARAAGYARTTMMATLSGEPLYRACGYGVVERVQRLRAGGIDVPGAIMEKTF